MQNEKGLVLTREDFRKEKLVEFEDLMQVGPKGDVMSHVIRTSSGTTGGMPMLSVSNFPSRSTRRFLGSKRPVVFFGSYNARLANTLFYLNKPKEGSVLLCFDPSDIGRNTESVVRTFKPDLLIGIPSYIMKVFSGFSDKNLPESVSRIHLSGEFVSAHAYGFLEKFAPHAEISSWYAVSELGLVGTNGCRHLKRNMYHLNLNITAEIRNPDETGVGELVVTRTSKGAKSPIPYLVGDLCRLMREDCPCGAKETIELFGRSRLEFVKVHGAQLHVEEFDRVLKENELYLTDYRLEVEDKEINNAVVPVITLKIEPTRLLMEFVDEPERLIAELFSEQVFVTPTQTLKEILEKGVIHSLTVRLCPGGFPLQNKNVKIQYVL